MSSDEAWKLILKYQKLFDKMSQSLRNKNKSNFEDIRQQTYMLAHTLLTTKYDGSKCSNPITYLYKILPLRIIDLSRIYYKESKIIYNKIEQHCEENGFTTIDNLDNLNALPKLYKNAFNQIYIKKTKCQSKLIKDKALFHQQLLMMINNIPLDIPGYYYAFGKWRSVIEWTKEPECRVSAKNTLYLRLQNNIPIKDALSIVPMKTKIGKYFEGFGEVKRMNQWYEDPRRPPIRINKFMSLLNSGISVEDIFNKGQ
jgi:hypothetical protein